MIASSIGTGLENCWIDATLMMQVASIHYRSQAQRVIAGTASESFQVDALIEAEIEVIAIAKRIEASMLLNQYPAE